MAQKPERVLKLLEDPEAGLCPSCGSVSRPVSKPRAVATGLALLLAVPMVVLIGSVAFGPDAMHRQSTFVAIASLISLGLAWQAARAGWNHECPICQKAALVPLTEEDRAGLAAEAAGRIAARTDASPDDRGSARSRRA